MTADRLRSKAITSDFSRLAGALGTLISRGVVHLLMCIDVARQRRQLAGLDDRALKDFGINRGDVQREISRSFFDIPRQ